MRKTTIVMLCMLALPLLALLSSCGGDNSPAAPNGPVVSTPRQFDNLVFTLSVPKATYAKGEQVPLTFTVKNVGTQTLAVGLGACDWFDTKVITGSRLLWQKSVGSGCGGHVQPLSIAPGETKTFNYSWLQIDQQGIQVPTGQYSIKSWFQPMSPADPNPSPEKQEANEFANPIQITLQ